MAKKQSGKEDNMTTIRVTRETTSKINDIKRMLELALKREITQEDVVVMAAEIAFGVQLEKIQEVSKRLLDESKGGS